MINALADFHQSLLSEGPVPSTQPPTPEICKLLSNTFTVRVRIESPLKLSLRFKKKTNLKLFLGLRTTHEKGLQIDCVSIEMSVKVYVVRLCMHACQPTVGTNTPRSNGGAMNPCTKDFVRHWKRTSSLVFATV